MFKQLNILDEKEKVLRKKAVEVTDFPLSKDEKKIIQHIIDQLTYSQIEEYEKKYNLRPGMGLAFPQLGILKRIIVIVHEVEEGKFDNYVFVNPVIVSHSEEMIAAEAFRAHPIEKLNLSNALVEIGKNAFNDKTLLRVNQNTGGDKWAKSNGYYLCGVLGSINNWS